MKKYFVSGSYLQHFECFVMAKNEDEAYELALSGDEDYIMGDCDDWRIGDIEIVRKKEIA
jgi:hypothetical protein